jgi:hypothetical protein
MARVDDARRDEGSRHRDQPDSRIVATHNDYGAIWTGSRTGSGQSNGVREVDGLEFPIYAAQAIGWRRCRDRKPQVVLRRQRPVLGMRFD